MTNDADKITERDEIEMLLPWYATGKLDAADMQRVDHFLTRHPELRARLSLSFAERDETAFLNGPAAAPSEATVERFMADVGRERPALQLQDAQPWLGRAMSRLQQGLDTLFPAPARVQWGAVAAAMMILVQAVIIVALLASKPDDAYKFAGDQQTALPGTYVLVRFADQAPAAAIARAMSELNLTIAGGPRAGGLFTLRIGPKDMAAADRDRLIAALKQRTDLVAFITSTK